MKLHFVALVFGWMLGTISLTMAQSYLNNIVKIESLDETGELGETGTGFVVGKSGNEVFIATAYHVIQDAYQISVLFNTGGGKKFEATLQPNNVNPEADFAVLTIEVGLQYLGLSSIRLIDPFTLKPGLQVLMVGNPGQGQSNWEINNRNALMKTTNARGVFSTTNDGIAPGFSGGPVFDKRKHIMGIVLERNAIEVTVLDIKQVLFQLQDWGINSQYLKSYKRKISSWTLPLGVLSAGSIGLGLYTRGEITRLDDIYASALDPTAPMYTDPNHPDFTGFSDRDKLYEDNVNRQQLYQKGAYILSGVLAAAAIWVNVKPRKYRNSMTSLSFYPDFRVADTSQGVWQMGVSLRF